MATDVTNLPSTPRPEYVAAAPDLALVRDLLGGTRVMQAKASLYLPKWPKESPSLYKRRATGAKVFGGLGRTRSAAVGMLFARAPKRSDRFTPEMIAHAQNIDGAGAKLDVFVKRVTDDALADGFTAVLVDFPPAPPGVVVTKANEDALGLRPYWAAYCRSDVISWRTERVGGATVLTQIVLREGATRNVGAFGVTTTPQYRVCRLVPGPDGARVAQWELLEERSDGGSTDVVRVAGPAPFTRADGTPFARIPVALCYASDSPAPCLARPPLLDVAWANLEHWQVASDLRWYERLSAFPQPTFFGPPPVDASGVPIPFTLGPATVVKIPDKATGDFRFTELTGSSMTQLRQSLADKKDEIGELGASFLVKATRGVETAEAKRLDAAAENATLATAAQGIEDGINQALELHAEYLGIAAADAPTITINTDFDALVLDAPTMVAYVQAVASAGLPPRILLQAWQDGGRLPPDTDLDALETEMLANARAAQDTDAAAAYIGFAA